MIERAHSQSAYNRAPITEAIIELKYSVPIDLAVIEKASGKFSDEYPHSQNIQTVDVQVSQEGNKTPSAAVHRRPMGYRRASDDMTELLILTDSSFVSSQLAPYPGWDAYYARFARDWKVWKRLAGFREINRIGVRYVNRIDIPISGPIVEFENYLNIYAKIPDMLGPVGGYAVQSVLDLIDLGCRLRLNSAVVPSPILNHMSILFDQDIAKDVDPPQSDDDIADLLSKIRLKKNEVFEACITDRARELFQN